MISYHQQDISSCIVLELFNIHLFNTHRSMFNNVQQLKIHHKPLADVYNHEGFIQSKVGSTEHHTVLVNEWEKGKKKHS